MNADDFLPPDADIETVAPATVWVAPTRMRPRHDTGPTRVWQPRRDTTAVIGDLKSGPNNCAGSQSPLAGGC